MMVGAFPSPGEKEPLFSAGESLYLAGKIPCPGQGQTLPSVGTG